jgi:dipeptide transport system permease protein
MFTFVLRRVGMVIPTFIGITILAFALIHLIPGDPIEVMMGERGVDPAMHAEAMKRLGLDQPLPMQYHYIGRALRKATSARRSSPTPASRASSSRAFRPPSSCRCARSCSRSWSACGRRDRRARRGSVVDHGVMGTALTGYSMPIFWWGLILIMLFSSAGLDARVGPHRRRIRHPAADRLHADRHAARADEGRSSRRSAT